MPELTISEIAQMCHARVQGPGDGIIRGLAALPDAGPGQASFLSDARYRSALETTSASCVLVREDLVCERKDLTLLVCEDPSQAFTRLIEAFAPPKPSVPPGVHVSAVVEAGAELAPGAAVGALCYVGAHAQLGEGVVLHPGVTVGAGVRVGEGSELHSGVHLYPGVQLGAHVIVHSGTVIGADGFGFEPTASGWQKVLQGGTVHIEDHVEIGANCTIDCARFGATVIGTGCKLDNLVHVAHNVQVGPHSLLIAQVGVAGSTRMGERVIVAGQAGISGHLTIESGARIAAGSKVYSNLAGDQDYFGMPAGPKQETLAGFAMMPRLREQLRKLKQRIARLEERS